MMELYHSVLWTETRLRVEGAVILQRICDFWMNISPATSCIQKIAMVLHFLFDLNYVLGRS
jgi:hypothetical protein